MPFRTPLDLYQERLTAMDRRRLLRPLDQTSIIDQAVRVLQLHGMRLMVSSLLPTSLCFLSMVFFGVFVAPTIVGAQATGFWGQAAEVAVAVAIFMFNIVPLFVIGISFATMMTSRLTAHYMLGDKLDPDVSQREAFRGMLGMSATIGVALWRTVFFALGAVLISMSAAVVSQLNAGNFIVDLIVILASTFAFLSALIVPPIVMGNVSLAPVVFAVEGISGLGACKRSKVLLGGSGHVRSGYGNLIGGWLLVLFVSLCIFGGISAALGVLGIFDWANALRSVGRFGPLFAGIIDTLPAFVTLWLVLPFYSAILTVLYYDRRVRLEAYDIKILAQDVLRGNSGRGTG